MASVDLDVAFVLHDLRNVLHTIGVIVELEEREGHNDRVEALRRCVRRAATLTADLSAREVATLDGGHSEALVDLGEICGEVLAAHAAAAASRGIRLTVDAPDIPVRVRGDPDQLERAVDNLVGNALQHGARAPGGRACMTLTPEGPHARLCVWDDGPGLPAAVLLQLGKPIPRAGGAGVCLGLAMVKRTAESHGGWLEPSAGTQGISLVLPLAAS
jgi:two-component system, OmpR family, sensor histidine kinase QseC